MADGCNLLHFGWCARTQAARQTLRRLPFRCAMATIGIAALGMTMIDPPAPRLVWNASASAPRGLYRVSPDAAIAAGDMVIARTPAPWRILAARRHYLPANVPLVKRVAATRGDRVCARGRTVSINGIASAMRRAHDGRGRPLPWWDGCRRL